MNCPHCNKEVPHHLIAKAFASIGGSRSKRTITPEQQEKMQQARKLSRKDVTAMVTNNAKYREPQQKETTTK